MMDNTDLWEWVDLVPGERRARIYRFGEKDSGAFVIGGLSPSQAKQIVEIHNQTVERANNAN